MCAKPTVRGARRCVRNRLSGERVDVCETGCQGSASMYAKRGVRETLGCMQRGIRAAQLRMFTALATIRPSVTSETSACRPITLFARPVSGIVSVGENAVAFVSET